MTADIDPTPLFENTEQAALGLAIAMGLPWADLVLEAGFGAGEYLSWRIANNWWPNTRHIAIDPLPIYAAQAAHLASFGVTWVQAVASDTGNTVPFYHDSYGAMGAVIMPGQAVPPDWQAMQVPVTTLDEQFQNHRHQARAIWVRIDCPGHIASILRGASATLAAADLVSVVLNLATDPMSLAETFLLIEQSGLRCFRIVDWHYADDTGQLLVITIVFARMEKMPKGMDTLDPASLAKTYKGLDHRRTEHIARIEAVVEQHTLVERRPTERYSE